jgi:L-ribulose-5-phosphate 4-epimerase
MARGIRKNSLTCQGQVKASSKSLTHAAIYAANPRVKAVIHVHCLSLML